MSKYKIALGLVTIAAAGIVTGLLIAPQKGKKLRKKIRKKCSSMMENINNPFNSDTEPSENIATESI